MIPSCKREVKALKLYAKNAYVDVLSIDRAKTEPPGQYCGVFACCSDFSQPVLEKQSKFNA